MDPPRRQREGSMDAASEKSLDAFLRQRPDIEAHVATVNKFWRPTPTPTKVEPSSEKTRCVTDFNDEGNEPQWAPVSVSKTCTVDSEPTSATAP